MAPDLEAGAFEHQVTLLNEVQSEPQVEIGAPAQAFQMSAELGEGCVVQLAVERHVVLDLLAGVKPVQDVALQVRVNHITFLQTIQRDPVERQRTSNILRRREKISKKLKRMGRCMDRWMDGIQTCSVVLTVTTSLSQGGKRSMVLHRKETMVSP